MMEILVYDFLKFVKIRENSFLHVFIKQLSSFHCVFELWNAQFCVQAGQCCFIL